MRAVQTGSDVTHWKFEASVETFFLSEGRDSGQCIEIKRIKRPKKIKRCHIQKRDRRSNAGDVVINRNWEPEKSQNGGIPPIELTFTDAILK